MDKNFKKGQLVKTLGKDSKIGRIAYVGKAHFAAGHWLGLVLSEPKGKNNGTVLGKEYFQCEENHGLFVKSSQVKCLEDSENKDKGSTTSLSSNEKTVLDTTPTSLIPMRGSRRSSSAELNKSMASSSSQSSFVEMDSKLLSGSNSAANISPSIETPTLRDKDKLIEALRCETKDLNEKLETLMIKRKEDKEKIKEYEKIKLQNQQLVEFKSQIIESQSELQKQLAMAKKEAKEAYEAKERHAEEMAELVEASELATLDREMAEEKCETLQYELEQCKTNFEEVSLELELLKEEVSSRGNDGVASDYRVKQLENHNERLKEGLVKMRDIAASDKQEHNRLVKEIDALHSEMTELRRNKEKMSALTEEYDKEISELKEQVDASLGAEKMVEHLTDANLQLEEKNTQLQDDVNELEYLQDINDQLVEAARETEQELREEIDMSTGKLTECFRKIEILQEAVADYEQTIHKYRDLTEKLRESNKDLRIQLDKESDKQASAVPAENFDYKVMFAETRAFAKVVEMELRKLDVIQADIHIKYLCSFMPDNFFNRGGDHESILILLLVPRLISKTEILASQIKEKYPTVPKVEKEVVLGSHRVDQYVFSCLLQHKLFSFQYLLHQYTSALNNCKVELFQKVGTLYTEVVCHEQSVDHYLELLRKDQLDETVNLEPLHSALRYFESLYNVHLSDTTRNGLALLEDTVKIMNKASEGINISVEAILAIVKCGEGSEIVCLLKEVKSSSEELFQIVKKIKRRLLQENIGITLAIPSDKEKMLYECCIKLEKVLYSCHSLRCAAQRHATLSEELTIYKLKELTHEATDKFYDKEDADPVHLKTDLEEVKSSLNPFFISLQDGEYDINTSNLPKEEPPVNVRAKIVKDDAKGMENLQTKLNQKEKDIIELRKALITKGDELSQTHIRKEMAEKRLEIEKKESDEKMQKIVRQYDESKMLIKKKEQEYEETLDHLQADIDSLESERGELREKLKMVSKKAYIDRFSKQSPSISNLVSASCNNSSLPVTQDSPLLLQKIHNQKEIISVLQNENCRLKSGKMKEKLALLPNLKLPNDNDKQQAWNLSRKIDDLNYEIKRIWAEPIITDLSGNSKIKLYKKIVKLETLKNQVDTISLDVSKLTGKTKYGEITTELTSFPVSTMKTGSSKEPIARLVIPTKNINQAKKIPLEIDLATLKQLHQNLVKF